MNEIRTILPILLAFFFIVHPSTGQSADNTITMENLATPENTTAMAKETVLQGPAALSASAATSTSPNLSYIWSVTGLEPGQVILSGSFIRPVEARKGDTFHADYSSFGCISCYFA